MINKGHFTHIYHPNDESLFKEASVDVIVFRYLKKNVNNITLFNNKELYLNEKNGIITFSKININNNTPILSDYFEVSVGLVNGKEEVYKNEEIGNFNILTEENIYTKYIYINEYPSGKEEIDNHLLKNKKILIERKIKKFNENNWWDWGAPRNITKMQNYKDQDCIYIRPYTRNDKVAFAGKVDYFAGLIMLRPKKKCDINKIIDYLNSEEFKFNYIYSGRFKIGHRQLCNSYLLDI